MSGITVKIKPENIEEIKKTIVNATRAFKELTEAVKEAKQAWKNLAETVGKIGDVE